MARRISSFIDYTVHPSAISEVAELVSQRYERLHKFHREDENPTELIYSLTGCHQPVHQHPSRGGD